jgi:hypothetical protein
METSTAKVVEQIKWRNPALAVVTIGYTGWLRKDVTGKRASSMMVEFDNALQADQAIQYGLVLEAQLLTCECYMGPTFPPGP